LYATNHAHLLGKEIPTITSTLNVEIMVGNRISIATNFGIIHILLVFLS
jgi:hypothetical protein